MVQDSEIALTLIEGTLVALPLWLAVLRYSVTDIENTIDHDTFSKFDEYFTLLLVGAFSGIGFIALLIAFMTSALVAVGANTEIEFALIALGVFVFVVGFQLTGGLLSHVSTTADRRGEALVILGIVGGIIFVAWIFSLIA